MSPHPSRPAAARRPDVGHRASRLRAAAAIGLPLLLYAACLGWLWSERHLVRDAVALPAAVLAALAAAAVLVNAAANPALYVTLLGRFGVRPPWRTAVWHRFAIATYKFALPSTLGDSVGLATVTRRWGLEARAVASVWLTDKVLAALSTAGVLAAGLLSLVVPVWVAAPLGAAAVVAVLCAPPTVGAPPPADGGGVRRLVRALLTLGTPRAYPRRVRLRLALASLAVESLHCAAYAAAVASVLDGGWGAVGLLDVGLVHVVALLPTALGGAGGREAATLVLFAGAGDPGSLFVAAAAVTVVVRAAPALVGVVPAVALTRSALRR